MNNENTLKLTGAIELLLENSNRINEAKPRQYWYPLSMATYGVEEIVEALDSLCSFRTSMWEKTLKFERKFAAYQGSQDAVMVNSGSSADLLLAFLLTDPRNPMVEKGSEILVPIVTWPTQIWSALMAGLKVRLVDVNPGTLNLDLDDLESKITPDTRAVFLVHLMGNPCQMDRVLTLAQKHNLVIVEDCCEALGAEWDGVKVGNFGIGGSFSFFFSHHITTMEGGLITCPNPDIADRLRILRAHGWLRNVDPTQYELAGYDLDPRYAFVDWGFNLRPTELQAGFGLHQLDRLPGFNTRRQELASQFFAYVDSHSYFSRPAAHPKACPAWFSIPLLVNADAPFDRGDVTKYLESRGVETRPIVAGNLARQPVADMFPAFKESSFDGADEIHRRGFYIGLSPLLSNEDMARLIETFDQFLRKY